MRILTKILPLFLSVAPVTLLAMDTDDTNGQKRPHNLISTTEGVESKSKPSKRCKTDEQESLEPEDKQEAESLEESNNQKNADVLDQTAPDQQNKAVYKVHIKHQQTHKIRQSIESLKALDPEIRKLLLGDHAENELQEMETTYSQLMERYARDFFARVHAEDFDPTKDLPLEIIQYILSYCSVEDLKNITLVSHAATYAVRGLPVLQNYFNNALKSGRYQNISEFRGDFFIGRLRAYAAAGIATLLCQQDKEEMEFNRAQSQHPRTGLPAPSYSRDLEKNKRNSWLDMAFNARNPLAIAFVFHHQLFPRDRGIRFLSIIKETYRKLGTNRDYILDTVILDCLQSNFEQSSEKRQILNIIKMFQTVMAHSIGANIMLCDFYRNGAEYKTFRKGKSVQVIAPDKGESDKYFKTAIDIANTLPDDLKGQAYTELGLWRLIGLSNTTDPTDQERKKTLGEIATQWKQAIDAWTKAADGDREKAVNRFKSFIYDGIVFSRNDPNKWMLRLSNPTDITFINRIKNEDAIRPEYLAFPYVFLQKLYESDKKNNDQLGPYSKDVPLLLRIAKKIWGLVILKHGAQLSADLEQQLKPELDIAYRCFREANIESLRGRDADLIQTIIKEIRIISQSTQPLSMKIQSHMRIAQMLGLNLTETAPDGPNTSTGS